MSAERFVRRGADGSHGVSVHPVLVSALLRRPLATNVRELDALLWDAVTATLETTILPTPELLGPMPRRPSLLSRDTSIAREPDDGGVVDKLLAGVGKSPTIAEARACVANHDNNKTRAAKDTRHQPRCARAPADEEARRRRAGVICARPTPREQDWAPTLVARALRRYSVTRDRALTRTPDMDRALR